MSKAGDGERRDTRSCEVAQNLARRLKQWRKSVGLSMKDVAAHLGVSVSIVCAWEQAKRFPNVCHLSDIAEYTGMSASELFSDGQRASHTIRRKVLEVDDSGKILSAAGRANGGHKSRLEGSTILEHVPGGFHDHVRSVMSKASSGAQPTGDVPLEGIEKAAWWLERITPVAPDGSTRKFLIVCANAPLQASERSAAATRAGGPIDRLSTLLSGMVGNLSVLRRRQSDGDGVESRLLNEVDRYAREALLLVRKEFAARDHRQGPKTDAPAILLIDSQPADALTKLELLGYEVILASNAEDGVRQARSLNSKVIAIVLDLSTPGVEGLRTCARLRAVQPETPLLVTVGATLPVLHERLQDMGVQGILRKPWAADEAQKKLAQALATA